MRETIWRQQLYGYGRFEPLPNSGRSLTSAYKLKALKSSFDMKSNYNLKEEKKLWKEVKDDTAKYEETITELKQKGQIRKSKQISCSWNDILV